MSGGAFDILFLPDDRRYTADGPVALYLAAAGAGILVEQPCGSQGICGDCRVRVLEGRIAPSAADVDHLSADELAAGWRLGCQMVVAAPATIEVPSVTRSLAGKSFGGDLSEDALARPPIDVVRTAMPAADASSGSALDRLETALGRPWHSLRASPRVLGALSAAFAGAGVPSALAGESSDELSITIEDGELRSIGTGRSRGLFGLAVDIGTTSLAAALVNLENGAVETSASSLNPQVAFGADVIARIHHAWQREDGLRQLTDAVRDGLRSLVQELLSTARLPTDEVVTAAVAGNPTMLHAWAGVGISSLGVAPYVGTWTRDLSCRAPDLGLVIHPNASVWVFPQVGSHVGADAVAAALACDMDRAPGRRLMVDLGTNTEVIVSTGDRLVAASAAAGPAFEGVSVRHGMRAAPGAVDVVSLADDGRVLVNTIGGRAAAGICGSGLIDLVAEMLRVGLVAPSGYLRRASELPSGTAAALRSRIVEVDGQLAFVVVADQAERSRGVILTARDIREVQLAKGSIMTAATLACRHVGFEPAELDEVLVAGAFGNYIRKASAVRIGLVPGIDPERIRLVGNAAGMGARLALVDRDVRLRARRLATRAENIELATRPDYQATFLELLAFPGPARG